MIEVLDRSVIDKKLESLIGRKQDIIKLKALAEGGKQLRDFARQTLVKKFPKANSAKGKSKRTMSDGIHVITDKQTKEVIVSIMKNYLNIWFELGTENRYLKDIHPKDDTHHKTYKKGEFRGKISPLHFFRDARESHSDEVIQTIESVILEELKNEFDNA